MQPATKGDWCARRITPVELSQLEQALTRCDTAARGGDHFLADEASQLKQRLKPYRRLQLQVRHRLDTSLAEHLAIFTAIQAGDAQKAEQQLREHVLIQGERFSDFVANVKHLNEDKRQEA